MNQEPGRSNDYEQHPEAVEIDDSRSALDFYQPNETEDWVDGFLKNHNDHEGLFEELPGTFVGISTSLSPSERNHFFDDPRTFSDGHNALDLRASDLGQVSRKSYNQLYDDLQLGLPQTIPTRSSLGTHQAFEPVYDASSISGYDPMPSLVPINNYMFPTPPVSTHVPTFFDSNTDLNGPLQTSRAVQTPQRLQFGSDARFEGPGFMAPPEQETEEALVRRRINHLECLKPVLSPASTQPPSPMTQKRKHSQIQYLDKQGSSYHQFSNQNLGPPQAFDDFEDADPTPKRKRKAVPDDDLDYEGPSAPARTPSKRTKTSASKISTPNRQTASTSRADSSKQRQASIKNNRQVLSEEQKKTNHIISEQKRRDLIRRGYEGIQVLVPALKNTKTSKGGMLESAANWLDDILRSNDVLRQQLSSLKSGRTDFA
ncbi:MAG: hypothetical protein Q9195_000648 [Heterodermia aff. obscurata]